MAACDSGGGDDQPPPSGTLGGRVLMTLDGPVVGAQVAVDHLEFTASTIVVRSHVADLITDDAGHFATPTEFKSGYFRVTTRGGRFTDYANGAQVVLDPTEGLTALLYTDELEDLTTGLVTPVTHLAHQLIAARTTAGTDATLVASHALVNEHLDRHFGDVPWERIAPADLRQRQASPTAEVRAAFILAAWSLVARDVATAAGATVQEVNPYTLAIDLGRDLSSPPFDGDDGNDRASGSGIQLATCPPVPQPCVPDGGCALGACRTACDAYAGTPRNILAAALTALINDNGPGGRNQTGLSVADIVSVPRAIAVNPDPILFGDACTDTLDRVPPVLTWGATPTEGAVVRGAVAVTVRATDDTDPMPSVAWEGGLVDSDGAASSAATSVDTTLAADGPRTIAAAATDATGNRTRGELHLIADNTPPVLTLDPSTFTVDSGTWWTTVADPQLGGTATDAHGPIRVTATVLGTEIAAASFPSGAWALVLPGAMIAAAGSIIEVRATDAVGNVTAVTAATSPFLRVDRAPPALVTVGQPFYNERNDLVSFGPGDRPSHTHTPGAVITLGGQTATCPVVAKHAYLTATTRGGDEVLGGVPYDNALRFKFTMSDAGIGLAPTTLRYTVTSPSGAVSGPFTLSPTPIPGSPGAYDVTIALHRDGAQAVPQLGVPAVVEESTGAPGSRTRFTVNVQGDDRLGQRATSAPCFEYEPLAPPLKVTFTGLATRPAGSAVGLLTDYDLVSGPTSQLLNGTADGGILEVRVKNPTGDPAYLTVSAPTPPAATFTKRITSYLQPTTQVTSTSPLCLYAPEAGEEQAICHYTSPVMADLVVGAATPITGWIPSIRVYDVTSGNLTGARMNPCAGCTATEWEVPPGLQRAIVVGAAGISDLAPDVAGPYAEIDGDFTGRVTTGTPERCIDLEPPGGVNDPSGTCLRRQRYRQNRTLKQATVDLTATFGTALAADWTTAAAPNHITASPPPDISLRRLGTFNWFTMEN